MDAEAYEMLSQFYLGCSTLTTMKVIKALIYAKDNILPLYWAEPAEDIGEGVERQGQQVEGCYQQIAIEKLGNDPLLADAALVYLLPLQPSETPTLPGAPESCCV